MRAFRAINELGFTSVAVFPTRTATRCTARRPTRATRSASSATRCAPTSTSTASSRWPPECGADAIYPGYGFLSENPSWPRPATTPASPSSGPGRVLDAGREQGEGQGRRPAGRAAGAAQRRPRRSTSCVAAGRGRSVPAVRQGRRRRRGPRPAAGRDADALPAAVEAAMREARAAFGDPTVFLEEAVVSARHIEVQVLADGTARSSTCTSGTARSSAATRRWSRSRRPPTWTAALRDKFWADAVTFARAVGYCNAGTVEFLVDPRRPPRVHRDEPAHPGRAHRHRGGHRRRPGPGPVADRGRGRPGRARDLPGRHPDRTAPPSSAGSPPRTRPTGSGPTPAASPPTARPAVTGSAWTAAPTWEPTSPPISTRCW